MEALEADFTGEQKYKWRNVRASATHVIARIVREDDKADEDWSGAIRRLPPERVAEHPKPPEGYDEEALRREWTLATLEPGGAFSLSHPAEQPTPEGGIEEILKTPQWGKNMLFA